MNVAIVMGLGILLGMQHATEADHLAAVSTLVGREKSLRGGLRHGLAWGLGHTLTLLVVAGGLSLAGWMVSPAIAARLEEGVGAMLVLLGLSLAWRLRCGASAPPGSSAVQRAALHAALPSRSLCVGMVHGLAGSAALALLVSQSLPSPAGQLAYIALFGAGSIVGMATLSLTFALSMDFAARRLSGLHVALNVAFACFSVLLGLRLLWPTA